MNIKYLNLVNARAKYIRAMYDSKKYGKEEYQIARANYMDEFDEKYEQEETVSLIGETMLEWLEESLHQLSVGEIVGDEFEYFLDDVAFEILMRRAIGDLDKYIQEAVRSEVKIHFSEVEVDVRDSNTLELYHIGGRLSLNRKDIESLLETLDETREEEDKYTIDDLGSNWY